MLVVEVGYAQLRRTDADTVGKQTEQLERIVNKKC